MIKETTKRGDTMTTPAGATGLYVGRTSRGLVWIAWEASAFAAMCARFDAVN